MVLNGDDDREVVATVHNGGDRFRKTTCRASSNRCAAHRPHRPPHTRHATTPALGLGCLLPTKSSKRMAARSLSRRPRKTAPPPSPGTPSWNTCPPPDPPARFHREGTRRDGHPHPLTGDEIIALLKGIPPVRTPYEDPVLPSRGEGTSVPVAGKTRPSSGPGPIISPEPQPR